MTEHGHETHPARLPADELLRQCDVRTLRRSGPGGQNRNKVETAVALKHRPTGVEAEASERRSQAANRLAALRRLRVTLAVEVRTSDQSADGPSPLWQGRCRDGRISVGTSHDDYPALLAEALDSVAAHGWDVRAAAERLGCTPTQLVRLLHAEPRAAARVNARRRELGLRPLRSN